MSNPECPAQNALPRMPCQECPVKNALPRMPCQECPAKNALPRMPCQECPAKNALPRMPYQECPAQIAQPLKISQKNWPRMSYLYTHPSCLLRLYVTSFLECYSFIHVFRCYTVNLIYFNWSQCTIEFTSYILLGHSVTQIDFLTLFIIEHIISVSRHMFVTITGSYWLKNI